MHVPKLGILLPVGLFLIGLSVRGAASMPPSSYSIAEAASREIASNERRPDRQNPPATEVWENAVGKGFRNGAWHVGASLGGGFGADLGSGGFHDLVLGTAHVGRMIGGPVGSGRWYRGNWDLMGEVFGGRQFYPDKARVVGLTPVLRYHFATGTRWIPFLEGGAGVSETDIGPPDLATRFEFHLIAGGGLQWFCCKNLAATFHYRLGHLSNANIKGPNIGLNENVLLLGVTWFL